MKSIRSARTPLALAIGLIASSAFAADLAFAADMTVKAPAEPPSNWDVAISSAVMSDYIFRGITQSAHQPSTAAGVEPRYSFSKTLEGYFGVAAESIDFPNHAAAELDFYAGVRPTFGSLALDFGVWYYDYPGGQCFNTPAFCGFATAAPLPNGNLVKQNESFYEGYGRATYTVNDNFEFSGQIYGSPSVLNSGASGIYYTGNVTLTAPNGWLPHDLGAYLSGDAGWWQLGTTDAFYGVPNFPNGIPYTSYANWDLGLGFTWKVLTLDLRYYQSNLSRGDCNAFTGDHTATGIATTAINPAPLPGSSWCGASFVAKFSVDLSLADLK